MTTTRIVLTEPFVRHPAGLVFEVNAAQGTSGWDDDERLRERLNFSDKRTYHLPDGGNGAAYDLPAHMAKPCPPGVFEDVDLHSGPCRVTGATDGQTGSASPLKYNIKLLEINGLAAQALQFPLSDLPARPVKMTLTDTLRGEAMREFPASDIVDCSRLLPGFYRLEIRLMGGGWLDVRFIKSFPLLVFFEGNTGRFSVQKTLY